MRVLFSITGRDGQRVDYGEVDLDERGSWFVVHQEGVEIAAHDRRELAAWSVCAPRGHPFARIMPPSGRRRARSRR